VRRCAATLIRRWSPASRVFALLSVVFGVAAFVVVHGYARRVEALVPTLGHPIPVVVAARDLPRGSVLEPAMLEVVTMPSAFAPPAAIAQPERVDGRTLLAGLATGEVVTSTRLAGPRAGPVAALVPAGLRAVALAVSLPPGAVRPGDRVDVLATYAGGQPHTETVAQGVEVLLVTGSSPGGSLDTLESGLMGGPALMLLVTPYGAERLAYARAFADLSVSIAGPDEVAPD
jgi:pilus assembly protein CpaB